MNPVTKTVFKIGDFVGWARAGQLDLHPNFQRRPVWKSGAKSYLVDTVIRGLPIPIVFLRDRLSLKTVTTVREVVDGQQRLRTLLSYINPGLVPDYQRETDFFKISKVHNPGVQGKAFADLPSDIQQAFISYEVPVHVFPADTEDRDILQIFARLNATGVKLNDQELRNAEWFGVFKSLTYSIAYQNLNRWQEWGIFKLSEISRMAEVEEVADLIISMHEGVHARKKSVLDAYYKEHDKSYSSAIQVTRRFEAVMSELEAALGPEMKATAFARKVLFNDLFVATYELMYGLGASLSQNVKPRNVPSGFSRTLRALSDKLVPGNLSPGLQKTLRGATGDKAARVVRVKFILAAFNHALPKG